MHFILLSKESGLSLRGGKQPATRPRPGQLSHLLVHGAEAPSPTCILPALAWTYPLRPPGTITQWRAGGSRVPASATQPTPGAPAWGLQLCLGWVHSSVAWTPASLSPLAKPTHPQTASREGYFYPWSRSDAAVPWGCGRSKVAQPLRAGAPAPRAWQDVKLSDPLLGFTDPTARRNPRKWL